MPNPFGNLAVIRHRLVLNVPQHGLGKVQLYGFGDFFHVAPCKKMPATSGREPLRAVSRENPDSEETQTIDAVCQRISVDLVFLCAEKPDAEVSGQLFYLAKGGIALAVLDTQHGVVTHPNSFGDPPNVTLTPFKLVSQNFKFSIHA